jgi:hypothetical protein
MVGILQRKTNTVSHSDSVAHDSGRNERGNEILYGRADQNLREAWVNLLNGLEKSRRFMNFVRNIGNRTMFWD